MGLESLAEGLLNALFGPDRVMAARMYITGLSTRSAPGHVWADYLFLSACYAHAAKDPRSVQRCLSSIDEGFPNYDPAKRFSWDSTGVKDLGAEDFRDASSELRRFQFKAPIIGYMNKFCESHPGFSFADAFGEYLPSAKGMRIQKRDMPEGPRA